MMSAAFTNIISAASKQANPPRCVLMTSIGVGGTSLHVKFVLSTLVAGCKVIADYERADALVRRSGVPYVLVRPGHLTNGPSMNKYTTSLKGFYHIAMKIARADVAKFLLRASSSAVTLTPPNAVTTSPPHKPSMSCSPAQQRKNMHPSAQTSDGGP